METYQLQAGDMDVYEGQWEGVTAWQKVICLLFTTLVASIPFFSVRNPILVVSVPLLILQVIAAVTLLRAVVTWRLPISVSILDIGLIIYFSLIVASIMFLPNAEGAKLALLKTGIYIATYICLKMALRDLSIEQIGIAARNGVLLGTCAFFAVATVCLAMTSKLALIFQSFDYYTITRNTFLAIDTVLGSGRPDDFEGRDIMRNAVAEAFTFYFLCTTVFRFNHQLTNVFLLGMNAIFIILTFSRRAFYAITIVILGGSIRDASGFKKGILTALLVGSIVLVTLFLQEDAGDSRLADFSDGGRFQQYFDAIEQFNSAPLVGVGFGTKLERGSYVHNFVFGSAAMLGIVGLLVALFIYSSAIILFLKGLAAPRPYNTAIFLVIPILSMTVGGTFEGLYTITGWIAIAAYLVCEEKQHIAELNNQQAAFDDSVVS